MDSGKFLSDSVVVVRCIGKVHRVRLCRLAFTVFFIWGALSACSDGPPALADEFGAMRSDAELASTLEIQCKNALLSDRPVLLEFGADWCTDCRRVEALKSDPELQQELSHWVPIKVNVGRYDRHLDLVNQFEVKSIARWIALAPDSDKADICKASPTQWRILADSVIEPVSGADSMKTAGDIVAWLQTARE